jgi:aminoglycoside N3'-acetyltransferase
MNLETRKKEKIIVTKENIKKGLRLLGLKIGEIVGVHSSLNRFGYVCDMNNVKLFRKRK